MASSKKCNNDLPEEICYPCPTHSMLILYRSCWTPRGSGTCLRRHSLPLHDFEAWTHLCTLPLCCQFTLYVSCIDILMHHQSFWWKSIGCHIQVNGNWSHLCMPLAIPYTKSIRPNLPAQRYSTFHATPLVVVATNVDSMDVIAAIEVPSPNPIS